mmetsp:Transcript_14794/g.23397  ORF Transcript_14794/g.23397 Transcript_14794/m.23397 type:complete len:108 (+) Transcript_14794:79-402(+)
MMSVVGATLGRAKSGSFLVLSGLGQRSFWGQYVVNKRAVVPNDRQTLRIYSISPLRGEGQIFPVFFRIIEVLLTGHFGFRLAPKIRVVFEMREQQGSIGYGHSGAKM